MLNQPPNKFLELSMLQTHKLIDLVDLTTFHIFENTVDPDLKNKSTRAGNGILSLRCLISRNIWK